MVTIRAFTLYAEIFLRDNEVNRQLTGMESSAKKTGLSFSKLAGIVGSLAIGAKLVDFGKSAVMAASDAAEMQSKFTTVFGTLNKSAEEWASNFQSKVGGSRLEIKGMIADSQDMLTGFGASSSEAMKFSTQIQTLGTDLASFQNLGTADAVERVRKGLLGETENLKALGIVINENIMKEKAMQLGYSDNIQSLTELEKIQIRYAIATDQSKNATGDAEKTHNSFANQLKDVKGRWSDITAEVGEKLLPIMGEFVNWVSTNMPTIQEKVSSAVDVGITAFSKFSDAVKWAKDNSDWLIPVLASVVSGLVSFSILTTISGLINTWRTGTLAATLAQGGLNAVLAANPFGAAALVIGVLVAAGIALWKNWDTVTAKATELKSNIKTKFDEIKLAITTPINAAVETVRQKIQAIKDFFAKLVLNIPKPKLPHFSVTGKFDLIPPDISVPKLGVDWYAKGTDNFKGGLAGINEYGKGEIVNLPNGSQIIPHDISKEMAKGSGQANIVIENMNVRNDNDIKLIARELYNLQQNKNRALGVV